jgi:hypothetical protein
VGRVTLVVRGTTSVCAEGYSSAAPPPPSDDGPDGPSSWLEPVGVGQER